MLTTIVFIDYVGRDSYQLECISAYGTRTRWRCTTAESVQNIVRGGGYYIWRPNGVVFRYYRVEPEFV